MLAGRIAPTDLGWYRFLHAHPELDEINFWTPSAHHAVRAEPGEPFLFKLKSPDNAICGFATFLRWVRLPPWLAWDCFGLGNGCSSLDAMLARVTRLRQGMDHRGAHVGQIGCVLLGEPVWFDQPDWVRQPAGWPARSLRATKRDLSRGDDERVWRECLDRARRARHAVTDVGGRTVQRLRAVRLGQGTFRIAVMESYGRACAITGEHSLPALEAAHIRPFSRSGPHEVRNGLLLRADLHRLFDLGYVTVTPRHRVRVSERLRTDFANGRTYYPLDGTALRVPPNADDVPDPEQLAWHNEYVFLAS